MDGRISSFPLTMVSHRLGEAFSVKPCTGDIGSADWDQRMPYDHDLEITRPWYYSTWLVDEGITVEFTPGKKSGYYRFSFPAGKKRNLLLNVYNGGQSSWHFLSGSVVTGTEIWQGNVKVYVYGVFNVAGTPDRPNTTWVLFRVRTYFGMLRFQSPFGVPTRDDLVQSVSQKQADKIDAAS